MTRLSAALILVLGSASCIALLNRTSADEGSASLLGSSPRGSFVSSTSAPLESRSSVEVHSFDEALQRNALEIGVEWGRAKSGSNPEVYEARALIACPTSGRAASQGVWIDSDGVSGELRVSATSQPKGGLLLQLTPPRGCRWVELSYRSDANGLRAEHRTQAGHRVEVSLVRPSSR